MLVLGDFAHFPPVHFHQTKNVLGHYEWRSDGGDIRGKEYLPVKQLRFGDTGTLYDDKRGKYLLGSLKCIMNGTVVLLGSNNVNLYL